MACVIKFFDIFGNSFSPTVSYQSKTNTVFGGLFGLAYLAISLYLCYEIGEVMVLKNDPIVVEEDVIDKDTEVNFSLPITYSVWLQKRYVKGVTFDPVETEKEFQFIRNNLARLITYKAGYTNMSLTSAVPFKNCNIYDFHDDPTLEQAEIINKLQCLDFNKTRVSLYHSFGVPTVRTLEISLWMCENTTDYNNCFSYEEQDYYLRTYDFRYLYYFAGYVYKPRNYEKEFSKFLDLFYSKLIYVPNFYPGTHYLKIQNVELQTDVGVFGQDLKNKTAQRISGMSYLVGGDPYEIDAGDHVFRRKINQLVLFVDKSTKRISRKYPKIQEIIANVAGVVSILGFGMQFFLQKIYDSKTYEIILHQLFDINEDLINGIPKKSNLGKEKRSGKVDINPKNDEININNNMNGNNNIKDLNNNKTKNAKFKRKSEMVKINEDFKQNNSEKKNIILNFNIEKAKEVVDNPNKNNSNINLDNSENKIFKNNEIETSLPQRLTSNILPAVDPTTKKKTSKYIINNSDFSWKNHRQKKYDAEFKLVPENKIPTAVKCLDNSKGKDNEIPTNCNYDISNTKVCLLNFCDHFFITYFKCCLVGRTAKINKYYEELRDIVNPYTDILNITNNIFEMEKLKYLLMDEDQVAVFNYRSKIEVSKCYLNGSKFNDFYYFMKDLNDNIDVELIKNELVDRDNQKRFNFRLKNLSD